MWTRKGPVPPSQIIAVAQATPPGSWAGPAPGEGRWAGRVCARLEQKGPRSHQDPSVPRPLHYPAGGSEQPSFQLDFTPPMACDCVSRSPPVMCSNLFLDPGPFWRASLPGSAPLALITTLRGCCYDPPFPDQGTDRNSCRRPVSWWELNAVFFF